MVLNDPSWDQLSSEMTRDTAWTLRQGEAEGGFR